MHRSLILGDSGGRVPSRCSDKLGRAAALSGPLGCAPRPRDPPETGRGPLGPDRLGLWRGCASRAGGARKDSKKVF